MSYLFWSRFHPKLIDVVYRNESFWETHRHKLVRERTMLHSLALVTEGAGLFELNGQTAALTPGVVFQIWPGCAMSITTTPERPVLFYSVQFRYCMLEWDGESASARSCEEQLPLPGVSSYPASSPLRDMFESAYKAWRGKTADYEWRVFAQTIQLLERLTSGELRPSSADEAGDRLVGESIDFMKTHYKEPISRDRLAGLLSLSPAYFSTMFRKRTGYSPVQYLTKIRLDEAKRLLRSTRIPVADVAAETGFADSFYFARVFAKETGLSPSEFRKG
jgi:AraC-like DNA-binding protein